MAGIMKRYDAPWSPLLRWVSGLVTLLCVGLGFVLLLSGSPTAQRLWMIPPTLLVACAPFTIRGYGLDGGVLEIQRLFWTTRIPLQGLTSAELVPHAMRGSVRTLGNGGLFSFSGWYWSRALGVHRVWVTDLRRTVVLRVDSRTLVVSPSPAEAFLRQVRALLR